ncbi:MAG: PilZ domain-containing protein [Candidatus Omnitrophota bacterium]
MPEQRRYHRMKIHLPVCFETENPVSFICSSTIDISPTGLAIRLEGPIKQGQFVTLSVEINPEKTVKVDAEVIWVKKKIRNGEEEYRAGLKIIDKMDKDETEFIRFVAKKMTEIFKTQQ